MFFFLASIGGFLLVLGFVMILADTLLRNWQRLKRGFILLIVSIPFVFGAVTTAPKPAPGQAGSAEKKINDPFYNAIQKARDVKAKVEASRQPEEELPATSAPIAATASVDDGPVATPEILIPAATPASTPTLNERIADNRAAFKQLEADFASLNAARQTLDRKNPAAIKDFNEKAKGYQEKLDAARSEQARLLETAP